MKKVTAFVGSAHKWNTHNAAVQYMKNLQALGEVETEIVTLSDYRLGICRGCRVCFEKGEARCPLKDDRDVLMDKIAASDGVVFATPNYTWGMSGMMKVFLDRFGFICHRPRYFGKVCTSIVVQAMGRGEVIVDTLEFTGMTLGFNSMKGITITAWDPRTEKQQKKIDQDLVAHSKRFYAQLTRPAGAAPTLYQLAVFRMARSGIKKQADPNSLDYHYYADHGWFQSDYFYPTRLNLFQRAAGHLMDEMAPLMQKMM